MGIRHLTSKDIVDNYRNMFESKISAGATEKVPGDMFESRISAGIKEKLPTRASGKPETKYYLFMVL